MEPILFQIKNLTAKEVEVAKELSKGKLNKEIAYDLNISLNTVKKHIKNIYKKIGLNNRIEFITTIYKRGA